MTDEVNKMIAAIVADTEILSMDQFNDLVKGDMFDFGSMLQSLPGTDITWVVDAVGLDRHDGVTTRAYIEFKLYLKEAYLTRVQCKRTKEGLLSYRELLY